MKNIDDEVVVAKGGRGGRGNAMFKVQQTALQRLLKMVNLVKEKD